MLWFTVRSTSCLSSCHHGSTSAMCSRSSIVGNHADNSHAQTIYDQKIYALEVKCHDSGFVWNNSLLPFYQLSGGFFIISTASFHTFFYLNSFVWLQALGSRLQDQCFHHSFSCFSFLYFLCLQQARMRLSLSLHRAPHSHPKCLSRHTLICITRLACTMVLLIWLGLLSWQSKRRRGQMSVNHSILIVLWDHLERIWLQELGGSAYMR